MTSTAVRKALPWALLIGRSSTGEGEVAESLPLSRRVGLCAGAGHAERRPPPHRRFTAEVVQGFLTRPSRGRLKMPHQNRSPRSKTGATQYSSHCTGAEL